MSPDETSTTAEVYVRLTNGERVAAGSFDEPTLAEARAQELVVALGHSGEWPQLDGRVLRPDTVVSIDVLRFGT